MKVKYIGPDLVALKKNKVYKVLDIKHVTYKIMTEIDETYYIPAKCFEIVKLERPSKNGASFNRNSIQD
ncbi:MAG: hypothetical protein IJH82_05760 [Lachnospiraceae bacterium]|nr:hypothetical protein [Lachnospiraceae bacterium]